MLSHNFESGIGGYAGTIIAGRKMADRMDITTKEADLLKETLAAVSADPRRAADLFYDELFHRMPEARDLFVSDMSRQGDKLIATLNVVILQIQNWSSIETDVEDLGLRHVAYGVRPEHYAPTGAALYEMLQKILGDTFTDAHRAAWEKAYQVIANAMINAIEKRKSAPQVTATKD